MERSRTRAAGVAKPKPELLLAWSLGTAALLWLWPDCPLWATGLATAGTASIALLLIRVMWVAVRGYERKVGLRIITRARSPKWVRVALLVCTVVCLLAAGVLWWLSGPFGNEAPTGKLINALRLVLVAAVASFSVVGLLMLVAQRFSVFGTTSIFGVVLGVAALLVVQSVATGFQHEFERRVLGVYAHINVTRTFGIAEYRRFEAYLRTLDGVEGASPFVYYGMALAPHDPEGKRTNDIKLASVLVKGIEPSTAREVIDLADHLEKGSGRPVPLSELKSDVKLLPVEDREDFELPQVIADTPDPRGEDWYPDALMEYHREPNPRPFDTDVEYADDEWVDPPEDDVAPEDTVAGMDVGDLPTMFIGYTLADKLDLEVGDVVRLVDPGSSFDFSQPPKFMYYQVAGVFEAGFQEYDDHLVYVHIRELSWFKWGGQDQVSGVDLRLEDANMAADVGAEIRENLGEEYSILEWQKLNENLFSSIRTQKNAITIILSLVIFVASFNVAAALWIMVVRRTAEIAIIMSMGATRAQIARIFQVTGMTIGMVGSLAGIAYGLILCWLVSVYGYNLDPEVYFIEQLPVEVSVAQIGMVLALTLVICFIATILPSLRASWLRPVEGLRYE